jgi:hypothetical protein
MKRAVLGALMLLNFLITVATVAVAEEAPWNFTIGEQWASRYLTNSGRVPNQQPGMVGTISLTSPTGWSFNIWHYYSFKGGSIFNNPANETDYYVFKHWDVGRWEIEPALTFQDYSTRPKGDVVQPSIDLRYKLIEGDWSLRLFYRLEVPVTLEGNVGTFNYVGTRGKTYWNGVEFYLEPFFTFDDGRLTDDSAVVFASKAGIILPLKKVAAGLNDFYFTAEIKSTVPLAGGKKTIDGWQTAGYFGLTYSHDFLK